MGCLWAHLWCRLEDSRTWENIYRCETECHTHTHTPFTLASLPHCTRGSQSWTRLHAPSVVGGGEHLSKRVWFTSRGQPFLNCEKLLYPSEISWLPCPPWSRFCPHRIHSIPLLHGCPARNWRQRAQLQNFPFRGLNALSTADFPAGRLLRTGVAGGL